MWAGTSALKKIDSVLQGIRRESVSLNSQLKGLTSSMAVNQRQRLAIIEKIAQVRLSAIEYGELNASLTTADKQALETLKLRDQALLQVNNRIDSLSDQISESESNREGLLESANKLAQQLVDIEAKVQAELSKDPDFLAQLEKTSAANAVSHEADQKVDRSQADMAEKAKPYKEDALFQYLWERKFGTPDYKAGFFARYMDTKVAKLINYNEARVNYWNLTEIPKRLEDHADHVASLADDEHEALQQLELSALENAGANEITALVEQARDKLDECDDKVESLENDLNEALAKRTTFISGEDTYLKKSLSIIARVLESNNFSAIQRYVLATHSPTDDQLVIELQNLDYQIQSATDNLESVKYLQQKQSAKLSELEVVRRNFKNSRFDDVRSGFNNQGLVVDVLGQFVNGLVDGSGLWETLKRNQRYRELDVSVDFGSGQFENAIGTILGEVVREAGRQTRRKRRSTWNVPRSRRSSSRRSSGGSRRSSGGGFRTGGGF